MPRWTAGGLGIPVDDDLDWSRPPTVGTPRESAVNPCLEANRSGRVLMPANPVFMSRIGTAAARRRPPATSRLRTGRRITRFTTAAQKRPSAPALSALLPTIGMRSAVDAVAEQAEHRRE